MQSLRSAFFFVWIRGKYRAERGVLYIVFAGFLPCQYWGRCCLALSVLPVGGPELATDPDILQNIHGGSLTFAPAGVPFLSVFYFELNERFDG